TNVHQDGPTALRRCTIGVVGGDCVLPDNVACWLCLRAPIDSLFARLAVCVRPTSGDARRGHVVAARNRGRVGTAASGGRGILAYRPVHSLNRVTIFCACTAPHPPCAPASAARARRRPAPKRASRRRSRSRNGPSLNGPSPTLHPSPVLIVNSAPTSQRLSQHLLTGRIAVWSKPWHCGKPTRGSHKITEGSKPGLETQIDLGTEFWAVDGRVMYSLDKNVNGDLVYVLRIDNAQIGVTINPEDALTADGDLTRDLKEYAEEEWQKHLAAQPKNGRRKGAKR